MHTVTIGNGVAGIEAAEIPHPAGGEVHFLTNLEESAVNRTAYILASLAALAAPPAQAGAFDQFEDIGDLARHVLSGANRDGIPAMTNPQVVAPEEVSYVAEDDLVIGVVLQGEAVAYPENLGWWHEIINARVGDRYVSATLCPLTGTALVFDATDEDGSQIEFGVSGLLINSNLVMYDRRDDQTLYPQMIYTGMSGPRKYEQLQLLPAVETTWAMWKRMHPDTRVVQAATGLERYSESQRTRYYLERYLSYPYGEYRTDHGDLFLFGNTTSPLDLTLDAKDVVLGICQDRQVRAYPLADLPEGAVVNDELGGAPLLLVFDAGSRTAIPYRRQAAGQELTFYGVEPEGELPVEFMDVQTRSRWNMLGHAVSGPLAGERLEQVPAYNSMWFAWSAYWPETDIWHEGGIIEEPPPVTAVAASGADLSGLPEQLSLGQNFPNPFNPVTFIPFAVPRDGPVSLDIYNGAGQRVRTLAAGFRSAGSQALRWDGRDDSGAAVASGAYFYRLEMPEAGWRQTRSMTLMR